MKLIPRTRFELTFTALLLMLCVGTNLPNNATAQFCRNSAVSTLSSPFDKFDPAPDAPVHTVAVQCDGKLLIGGEFTKFGINYPVSGSHIARLNVDGSIDYSFNSGNVDATVTSILPQNDGKILVGGSFTVLGGQSIAYFGRLNPDGTPD